MLTELYLLSFRSLFEVYAVGESSQIGIRAVSCDIISQSACHRRHHIYGTMDHMMTEEDREEFPLEDEPHHIVPDGGDWEDDLGDDTDSDISALEIEVIR
ncbi:hypothetical protein TIFTF001_035629 [Ficus carica]|uniref:Uncharacterized protein n=1 Tax=Ficus carica TaxID=3494 RepID=A0AA88E1Y0_FICCA|nr:hypothetical protein TIFTF001_035629 [Ficus carica]